MKIYCDLNTEDEKKLKFLKKAMKFGIWFMAYIDSVHYAQQGYCWMKVLKISGYDNSVLCNLVEDDYEMAFEFYHSIEDMFNCRHSVQFEDIIVDDILSGSYTPLTDDEFIDYVNNKMKY